jgi:hypothetical protein
MESQLPISGTLIQKAGEVVLYLNRECTIDEAVSTPRVGAVRYLIQHSNPTQSGQEQLPSSL